MNQNGKIFVRADDRNLPIVDSFMLLTFLQENKDFNIAEVKGWKASQ